MTNSLPRWRDRHTLATSDAPSVLVTGNAGFIGFHVAMRLLQKGVGVVGFDAVNEYYDPSLKRARLAELERQAKACGAGYRFFETDLADRRALDEMFSLQRFDRVIHLAAQAGVRHSIEQPGTYVSSNLVGCANVLEACRHHEIGHLVYASSSSVYGANTAMPFSEHDDADHPIQLYAATKRANELMAHAYSHLFGIPTTGLRFFTVYGSWGRPDMALFKFARAILDDRPIDLFNSGNQTRDFTYIDDVVEAVVRVADLPPEPNCDHDFSAPDPATSSAPFRLLNIGNGHPVQLIDCVRALEKALGKTAMINDLPGEPGDMADTFANIEELFALTGFRPATSLEDGVERFAAWYRDFYAVAGPTVA